MVNTFYSNYQTYIIKGNFFILSVVIWTSNVLIISESDLQLNANDECELGVRSLGAVVWYLKRCKLDFQLLTRGRFDIFKPVDIDNVELTNHDNIDSKYMVGIQA